MRLACLEGLGNSLSHLKEVGLRTTTKNGDSPLNCPEEVFPMLWTKAGLPERGASWSTAGGAKLGVQQGGALEVRDA